MEILLYVVVYMCRSQSNVLNVTTNPTLPQSQNRSIYNIIHNIPRPSSTYPYQPISKTRSRGNQNQQDMREVLAGLRDMLKCYFTVNMREVRIEEGWECEEEGLDEMRVYCMIRYNARNT